MQNKIVWFMDVFQTMIQGFMDVFQIVIQEHLIQIHVLLQVAKNQYKTETVKIKSYSSPYMDLLNYQRS